MSRLAKIPILLPKGVECKVVDEVVHVKGPKGTLTLSLQPGIQPKQTENKIHVEVAEEAALTVSKAQHGLYRALINTMVIGVSKGFEKKLSLIGVGYRAAVQGKMLDLQLGYSHPTQLEIPAALQVSVDKSTTITISGIDKQAVGQFAAAIRALKPPEPYKGKGIRYEGEYVRKKAGKAAKGKAG